MKRTLAEIISSVLNIQEKSVAENLTLEALGADSLDVVDIIFRCDEEYGTDISLEDLDGLKTVGELKNLIERGSK